MQLNVPLKELLDVIEGASSFDRSFVINDITSLEKAGSRDIAVVFDQEDNSVFAPLSPEKIKNSKAALLLASKPVVAGKNYVLVRDPLVAVQKISQFIYKRDAVGIHSSAVVHEQAVIEDEVTIDAQAVIHSGAHIGAQTCIGAHVFIGKDCVIGKNVLIHPGAKILDRCVIGDYTIIHAGAVIGSDGFGYRAMKTGLRKVPHVGIVRIGNHVEIGANTCIDRAEFEETVISDGVKLDNEIHIAHNVKIGPSTAILAQTGIAGSVNIGAGCQIGGQVAIRDHISIGDGVKIVSKSAIMKDILAGQTVAGIPSMPFSQWKRMMVAVMKLPETLQMFKKTKKEVEKYLSEKRSFWRKLFG